MATPTLPTSPCAIGLVGVVAHLRRQVEGDGQAAGAGLDELVVALVALLGGAEAGVLAHRPRPPGVHRRVDAPRERVAAGRAELGRRRRSPRAPTRRRRPRSAGRTRSAHQCCQPCAPSVSAWRPAPAPAASPNVADLTSRCVHPWVVCRWAGSRGSASDRCWSSQWSGGQSRVISALRLSHSRSNRPSRSERKSRNSTESWRRRPAAPGVRADRGGRPPAGCVSICDEHAVAAQHGAVPRVGLHDVDVTPGTALALLADEVGLGRGSAPRRRSPRD